MKKRLFILSFISALFFIACGDTPTTQEEKTPPGIDTDGDGIPDISIDDIPEIDTDGDGIPDFGDDIPGTDSDGDGIPDIDDDNDPGTDNEGDVYKDKEDFQNIAIELRNEIQASDFENVMELAEFLGYEYSEYNFVDGEQWLEECYENLWQTINNGSNYEIYEATYRLSAFKGKWVANERTQSWERTDADNLSLHAKDQNGNPCEITLTTAGKTKKVLYYQEHDERVYIEVPETIYLVLKQNGSTLAQVLINTDLSSMVGEEFNLAEDKYQVKASVYFNGYTLYLENLCYANKQESEIAFSFKHGNKTLIAVSLTATPEIDVDEEYEDEYTVNSKNNTISINILNKMQLKGTCNNISRLAEVLDEDFDENTASKVNRFLKLHLYFYGSNDPTASIIFESERDDYYGGYSYDLIPVIEFKDYSKHSLEDFFNEDDFEKTVDAFESLFNQFEDLVRGYDFDF